MSDYKDAPTNSATVPWKAVKSCKNINLDYHLIDIDETK
jgi:hypothetical protein